MLFKDIGIICPLSRSAIMHKLTFFNLGNADSCRIDLANGKKILIDFGNQGNPDDQYDLRCDLAKELRDDLEDADRDFFDVVAISHLDKDHYQGASDFFWLQHAKKYQGDDRIKIKTLWVPAAVITETGVSDDEGKVIQAEAQYRLKQGKDVRVFSRPEKLRKWLKQQGIK
ncbi:MBL fold metallo-hydrolase, partial [Patescibacteria group bacterium]|nr:MBL fold metallo-hydrolase [Patescibacteria group bacterium]